MPVSQPPRRTLLKNTTSRCPECQAPASVCKEGMEKGCDNTDLDDLLKQFELRERDTFRLFIKPFMDAWTWDEDRIDRCCTHVIRPDGKLDSFCRYYATKPATS